VLCCVFSCTYSQVSLTFFAAFFSASRTSSLFGILLRESWPMNGLVKNFFLFDFGYDKEGVDGWGVDGRKEEVMRQLFEDGRTYNRFT
jgi:hypothetical protein